VSLLLTAVSDDSHVNLTTVSNAYIGILFSSFFVLIVAKRTILLLVKVDSDADVLTWSSSYAPCEFVSTGELERSNSVHFALDSPGPSNSHDKVCLSGLSMM
jgi:hypothetical protein